MTNKVAETIRELRAINYKLETVRTETRRFLEVKDLEMKCLQDRINILCTGLVEGDAALLGGGAVASAGNGVKRGGGWEQKPEVGSKRIKPEVGVESYLPIGSGNGGGGMKFDVEDGYTHVYTDGACSNNGKGNTARAGVGVWWGEGHKLNLAQRVAGERETNNVAEIQAATMSISQAIGAGITKLQVNTDSQFLINCVTLWMQNWKRNGWRTATKQDVKNKEELVELDKLLQTGTIAVKWKHVKGHSDIKGNIEADKLAVKGATMPHPSNMPKF